MSGKRGNRHVDLGSRRGRERCPGAIDLCGTSGPTRALLAGRLDGPHARIDIVGSTVLTLSSETDSALAGRAARRKARVCDGRPVRAVQDGIRVR